MDFWQSYPLPDIKTDFDASHLYFIDPSLCQKRFLVYTQRLHVVYILEGRIL